MADDVVEQPAESSVRPAARSRRSRLLVTAAVLVVAVGVVQRLWAPSPLWLDEAQTVAIADRPLGALFDALRLDGAPPLYYVLLHGWIKLFGDSDAAVRAMSSLFSILALPVAYRLGTLLGGSRRHGLLFLLVLAANPWAIRYAIEARQYAFVQLLALLAALAAYHLVHRRPGTPGAVLATAAVALVTGALLLTHYWALFLGAVVGWWLLWRAARHADRPTALLGVAGLVAGALLFLPWVPAFLYQAKHTGAPWAATPDLGALAALPVEWFGGDGPAGRLLGLLVWPLMLLGVLGRPYAPHGVTVDLRWRGPGSGRMIAGVVLGTLVLALLVSIATGGAVVGRYTAVVAPLAFYLVVLGLVALPGRYALRALAVLTVVGLLAGVTIVRSAKSQSGELAGVLAAQARSGDVVVFCPDQLAPAVLRGLDAKRGEGGVDVAGLAVLTRPAQAEPRLIDWTDYLDRIEREPHGPLVDRAAAATAAGGTVWLAVAPSGYRTHETDCPDLQAALVTRLGAPQRMVEFDDSTFEKAELLRFRPRRA